MDLDLEAKGKSVVYIDNEFVARIDEEGIWIDSSSL